MPERLWPNFLATSVIEEMPALRRELDDFAWDLISRLAAAHQPADVSVDESPLDSDRVCG